LKSTILPPMVTSSWNLQWRRSTKLMVRGPNYITFRKLTILPGMIVGIENAGSELLRHSVFEAFQIL
jgi:hypothetical protein